MDNDYKKLGLSEDCIKTLELINDSCTEAKIKALLIKAHNHGFKKGVNETIKTIKEGLNSKPETIIIENLRIRF